MTAVGRIHPRLHLGSLEDANLFYGATVCVASEATRRDADADYETHLDDDPRIPFRTFKVAVDDAAKKIDEAIGSNESVMVHCYAGINRSASALVHYACKYRGMDRADVVRYITKRNARLGRPALTNRTFRAHLTRLHSPTRDVGFWTSLYL
jgi:hypothetical protein